MLRRFCKLFPCFFGSALKLDGISGFLTGLDYCTEKKIYGKDFGGKVALVIGGEDGGVKRLTREKCDYCVSLPLKGKVNSLNASVALGIAAYEAVRKRQ